MNDRQKLEAIVAVVCKYLPPDGISREDAMSQIIGLVDPLPAQPEQEPIAWKDKAYGNLHHQNFGNSIPLYTAPPKQWVGLHLNDMPEGCAVDKSFLRGARWAEAKLKEKNT